MRILFIQHHDIASLHDLPLEIKGFTTFALLIFMHLCTPFDGLEWYGFLTQVFDLFAMFAATNFFVAVVRSSFTRGIISASMTCPAAPVSIVALMFTQLSLTSMTFFGDGQDLLSTLSNDSWATFFDYNFDIFWDGPTRGLAARRGLQLYTPS